MKNEISTILKVKDQDVRVLRIDEKEYISLTDLARYADNEDPRLPIQNWMRNKDVISFLGLWETINNDNFKRVELDAFKNEAGSAYREDIIGNYSNMLTIEVDKKYNPRTLRRMRKLYQFFEKQKWSPVGTNLSISHIRQLFSLADVNEINYYREQIEKRNLSKRQLEEIIRKEEYELILKEGYFLNLLYSLTESIIPKT